MKEKITLQKTMWLQFLLLIPAASAFSLLNQTIDIILSPKSCRLDTPFVTVIHSAPKNSELRNAIRETWGVSISPVFILGYSHEYNENLREEHDKYKDILQLNFTDAYRNMTYKHLAAYWWVANQCGENVQYVLKTDDDQAVDVHHLQLFMEMFILPKKLQNFFLCHYLEEQVPRRDPENKWHVSRSEYESDSYPNFCSGWAYVTNINTLTKVLEASHHQPYFWIDDLWVTGHLVEQLQIPVHIFNWKNNFLSEHIQAKDDLLKGKMFTPELMVASDLEPGEIRHLASKFDKCHKKQCYNQVYDSQELKEYMRPPMTIRRPAASSMKTEL